MVPLSVALPFPQSLREFWLNWPNFLDPGLAVNLALSPARLNSLFKAMLWALRGDELQKVRQKFDILKLLPSNTVDHDSDSVTRLDQPLQDCAPPIRVCNAPEILYVGSYEQTTMTMNSAALGVLGYSKEILKDAVVRSVHCFEQNPDFLPFLYKLFHPDSWLTLSTVLLNFYLHSPANQRFYCQLARCDGSSIPVHMAMSISFGQNHTYRTVLSFMVAEPPTFSAVPATVKALC